MVTAIQISAYLDDVYEAQAKFMDKLVRREKLGSSELFSDRVIASILNSYVTIVTDYFSQPVYDGGYFLTTYNFFDEEEIKNIYEEIEKDIPDY